MRTAEDVAIIGAHASAVTRSAPKPLREMFADAAIATLRDAGVEPKSVDGLVTTPPGINPGVVVMFGAFLAKYLGLDTRCLEVVENGGATAALALRAAANEVALGRVRRCLVLAGDQRFEIDRSDVDWLLRFGTTANVALQGPYDAVYLGGYPVPIYAMSAQRYQYEFGTTLEDFARVVVQLRSHAARHPSAQYRTPTSVEEVLASPVQSPPLTLHMCCPVSTAAAGVLVTSVDEAKKLGRPFVRLAGFGGWHEAEHFLPTSLERDFTTYRSAVNAAAQAYREAGIGADDIDVSEIYGVYAPTELMLYEDLDFVGGKGQAPRAVRDGALTYGGKLVVNPSGGRICYGHPAAATPLLETVEIVDQLRGRAGERQVERAHWGLTHSEHGCLNGSVVTVYEAIGR